MDIPNNNELKVYEKDFSKNLNKYEFIKFKPEIKKRESLYLDNSQMMIKNYLSNTTIYENILLYHEVGTGKCHGKDEKIMMFNGEYKKVQDIKIDELIMGDDSTPRKVLSLARGIDKMYKVISSIIENDFYIVNSEHILCLIAKNLPYIDYDTYNDKYNIIYIENNNILIENHSIEECNRIYQKVINNKILEISIKDYLKLDKYLRELFEGYKMKVKKDSLKVQINTDYYILGFSWRNGDLKTKQIKDLVKDINSLEIRINIINGLVHKDFDHLEAINEILRNIKIEDEEEKDFVVNLLNLGGYITKDEELNNIKVVDYIYDNEIYTYEINIEEYKEDDFYYGFILDGNSRYITKNLTITHNTCTSITIAEGLKEYINNMGNKIVVLVKNKNIQMNFINEIYSKCTGEEYIQDDKRDDKYEKNKVLRKINKNYQFITYGTFVNNVLGMKEYIMKNGKNIVKRVNGKIQRKQTNNMINELNNSIIIIDEVHNITNNDIYIALEKVLKNSYNYRLVMLTATPIYDNVKEIFELINLLNLKEESTQLPIRNELKAKDYIIPIKSVSNILKGGVYEINKDKVNEIEERIRGKISYITQNKELYPEIIDNGEKIRDEDGSVKIIKCEMSDYQYMVYISTVINDVKYFKDYDISTVSNLESYEKNISSSLYKNTSDASTIVYPNNKIGKQGFQLITDDKMRIKSEYKNVLTTDLGKYSSKLKKLLDNINNSKGLVFIYSNYVSNGGINLVRLMLLENGYTEYIGKTSKGNSNTKGNFIMYDDSSSVERREKLRKIFNNDNNKNGDKIKIIIGSPIISEGINLRNIRQVHILEPSWNLSKINQIIGRAVRKNSHKNLPNQDRNVEVFKYASVYDIKKIENEINNHQLSNIFTFFIDVEKYLLSEYKDRENKKIERLLKENSFNCYYNNVLNKIHEKYNNTERCDYMKCEIECKINTNQVDIDLSTYGLHINEYDVYDVKYVENIIIELFKQNFVWTLKSIRNQIKHQDKSISLHVIVYVLNTYIDKRIVITDMFDRDGYIIKRMDMYIFNPLDKPIEMSYYDKYLNFEKYENKYTVNEYLQKELSDVTYKEKEKKKYTIDEDISDDIIEYNEKLLNENKIVGSFRSPGTKENLYGVISDVFKIIDLRKQIDNINDARKRIRGMNILSYKKPDLIDILNELNVESENTFDSYDKKALAKILQKYLIENNLVLK